MSLLATVISFGSSNVWGSSVVPATSRSSLPAAATRSV
jgi:hypothetical protein